MLTQKLKDELAQRAQVGAIKAAGVCEFVASLAAESEEAEVEAEAISEENSTRPRKPHWTQTPAGRRINRRNLMRRWSTTARTPAKASKRKDVRGLTKSIISLLTKRTGKITSAEQMEPQLQSIYPGITMLQIKNSLNMMRFAKTVKRIGDGFVLVRNSPQGRRLVA